MLPKSVGDFICLYEMLSHEIGNASSQLLRLRDRDKSLYRMLRDTRYPRVFPAVAIFSRFILMKKQQQQQQGLFNGIP